ncbi:hypothetical protein BGZ67_001840 [Mortierella alpina]|nr:hypothetical protein BGZ67_001840 [Mortierella alpina]
MSTSKTTSELILYLEPSRSCLPNSLWFQVHSFLEASRKSPWSDNEALRYPAHITMVGFFDSPDASSDDGHQQQEQQLIHVIDECVGRLCRDTSASSLSGSTVIQGLVRPSPDSLLLSIQPAPVLLQLTQHLQEAFPELGLRPKRINHLSLCYWAENNAEQQQQQDQESLRITVQSQREHWIDQAEQLARETETLLNVTADCRDSTNSGICGVSTGDQSWDMVLYSIQDRDKACLKPYPLVELKRWTLP